MFIFKKSNYYLFLGRTNDPLSVIERYLVSADKWEYIGNILDARVYHIAVVINPTYIFIQGGRGEMQNEILRNLK